MANPCMKYMCCLHIKGSQKVCWVNEQENGAAHCTWSWLEELGSKQFIIHRYLFSFFSTAFPLLPVIGWELGVRLVPYESISGYLKKEEYVYPFITNINTTASALVERGPRKSAHLFIMSGAKGPLCEVKTESAPCSPRNQTGIVMWDDIVLNAVHRWVRSPLSCWKAKRWNPLHLLWDSSNKAHSAWSWQRGGGEVGLHWVGPLHLP